MQYYWKELLLLIITENYCASVHAILQERISKSTEQFKTYVLSLLGDRHYEKIVEAVNKVDKSYTQGMSGPPHNSNLQSPPPPPITVMLFLILLFTTRELRIHPLNSIISHLLFPISHFTQDPPRHSPGTRNLKPGGATRRSYFCDYCGINITFSATVGVWLLIDISVLSLVY